jgi:periplasmic protein TonB
MGHNRAQYACSDAPVWCIRCGLAPTFENRYSRPLSEPTLTKPTRAPLMALYAGVAALLASCAAPYRTPTPQPAPAPAIPAPGVPADTVPPAVVIPPVSQLPAVSNATSALAYRRDAALHLYAHNAQRIYKGMLQPHLYAIGVLDVDIDRQGQVTGMNWRRAPKHAPEVMAEIVRTVRAAAPYPVPARLGKVTYSDVWLWDKSGQFQLDTLTEGQL